MPPIADAEEASRQPLEIGDSGRAYMQALGFRGIETDVGYFDPTAPPPPLDTRAKPRPPTPDEDNPAQMSLPIALVAGVILAGLALLALRYGGGISIALQAEPADPRRAAGTKFVSGKTAVHLDSLSAILAMRDRRRAIVELARFALDRTIEANGVLLQASWTARDALRHLPATQPHLPSLRDLVLAGERVQFGGRDVSEEGFHAHLRAVEPLLGSAV